MKDNIRGIVSEEVYKMKEDIRDLKEKKVSKEKILDLVDNNCYILKKLEEAELTSFDSEEELRKIVQKIKEEIVKESEKEFSDKFLKCDYYTEI